MKRFLSIALLLFLVSGVQAQVESLRKGNVSTVSVTNNLSDIGWQRSGANIFLFALTDKVGIGINTPDDQLHIWSDQLLPSMTIEGANATDHGNYPTLKFVTDDASPLAGQQIGAYDLIGRDAASALTIFGGMFADAEYIVDTDESGKLGWYVLMDGTARTFLTLDGYNGTVNQGTITLNDDAQDVDLIVESSVNANSINVVGSNGFVGFGIVPTTEIHVSATTNGNPDILFESVQGGTAGPQLILRLDSASPAANDEIASILAQADDDAGGSNQYAQIQFLSDHVANTDESGRIDFVVTMDNQFPVFLSLDGYNGSVGEGQIIFNDTSFDLDFRIESNNDANAFSLIGSTGDVGFGVAAPTAAVHIYSTTSIEPILRIENNSDGVLSFPTLEMYNNDSVAGDGDINWGCFGFLD